MKIFELYDNMRDLRRDFFGCCAKSNKTFKTNIIEKMILILCISRKITFLQFIIRPTYDK